MLRRLLSPRKRRVSPARPTTRLCLEPLEKREVLDAALVQGLSYLALTGYQTAQQIQHLQTTAQNDLNQFHSDAAAYTAGQGVSLGQINQDITKLKQDANAIDGANSTFQTEAKYFVIGLLANIGSFSTSDGGALFADAYFLYQGHSIVTSALQTAHTGSSVQDPPAPPPPSPPPSPPAAPVSPPVSPGASNPDLVTLTLNPLNVNLLGLNVKSDTIQVNISAQQGQADLVGNVLGDAANLLNLPAVNTAVNNVLSSAVTLLNSGSLSVANVNTTSGSLTSAPAGSSSSTTTSVLTLHVAPVKLNLLGAEVTTSPIDLAITAQPGKGLVLGNVVTDLANLFNPPLPSKLSIDDLNTKLGNLLTELNTQIPNVGNPTTPPVNLSNGQFLNLTVAPINLNLLGLELQTSPIQVNATNQTGNGDLLGNVVTTLLNTVGATPDNLTTLNQDLNAILGKVIGVLNASTLTLPANVVSSLPSALQQLTSPTLVNPSGNGSATVLNLAIASPDNSTPVNVDLLGLDITTSNIQAQLLAQTGKGQILGNLLYNLANLLNPGGSSALLPILGDLGL